VNNRCRRAVRDGTIATRRPTCPVTGPRH
jgi:hypothetical protein